MGCRRTTRKSSSHSRAGLLLLQQHQRGADAPADVTPAGSRSGSKAPPAFPWHFRFLVTKLARLSRPPVAQSFTTAHLRGLGGAESVVAVPQRFAKRTAPSRPPLAGVAQLPELELNNNSGRHILKRHPPTRPWGGRGSCRCWQPPRAC